MLEQPRFVDDAPAQQHSHSLSKTKEVLFRPLSAASFVCNYLSCRSCPAARSFAATTCRANVPGLTIPTESSNLRHILTHLNPNRDTAFCNFSSSSLHLSIRACCLLIA